MQKSMALLLTSILLIGFQNCSRSYSISGEDSLPSELCCNLDPNSIQKKIKEVSQNINVKTSGAKLDILMVVDNSGSMAYEQEHIAERMENFIRELGNKVDYQIAIITTDVSSDAALKDGRFLPFLDLPGSPTILKSKIYSESEILLAFGNTIKRPESGSPNEQGMMATSRAITRALDPLSRPVNAPNKEFFRPDASLDVVVISDADESPNTTVEDKIMTPEKLIVQVNKSFPAKVFKFHSIIVKPKDTGCLMKYGNEAEGIRYAKLSDLTKGLIGDVCASDYASQLSELGKRVLKSVRTFDLDCQPISKTGSNLKPEVDVSGPPGFDPQWITVQGQKLVSSVDLPDGDYSVKYYCNDL